MADKEKTPVEGAEEEKEEDLTSPNTVTKYRKAGEIANGALQEVIKAAKPGVTVLSLCDIGDKYIKDATSKIYNNKKGIEKGVAFPTCISVNQVVGHFSPLTGDATTLKENDLVKIDLGVHIDGFAAVAAHTIVLSEAPVTGRKADVIAAAYTAADAALRLLKPGNKNSQITNIIAKVAAEFKCTPVQGVLSHNMERFIIDGQKTIINKEDAEQKVNEVEFGCNEAWALDIVMSTGEGKTKEGEERTTVYKRSPEETYLLKRKASRAVLSEVTKRFSSFPFTLRELDEKTARFGIVECFEHNLVQAYPVLKEKDGEFVAHIKLTALILPSGTVQIAGVPVNKASIQSEHKVKDDEVLKVLATSSAKSSAAKKKKKKPAAKAGAEKKEGAKEEPKK